MNTKVAINGFGRIGRLVLRALMENKLENKSSALDIVAVNDLADVASCAHLFNYDSVHGRLEEKVSVQGDHLKTSAGDILFCAERDPRKLPWRDLGVKIVLECTGLFTSKDKAMAHCEAGASRILVSAPASDADATIVFGVNDKTLSKDHVVISNASCTTNCLAPVAMVLDDNFGIDYGSMTTIHAYTGDQGTVDQLHKDLRRARAAALSMIPTSTGAARAVGEVLPNLKGRIDGSAVRVPTPNVSLVDFVCHLKKECDKKEIVAALQKAAKGNLKGILVVNDEPLVSIDLNHTSQSATVDVHELRVMGGRLCRVLAWYDNEWGFANRMIDVASLMARLG